MINVEFCPGTENVDAGFLFMIDIGLVPGMLETVATIDTGPDYRIIRKNT